MIKLVTISILIATNCYSQVLISPKFGVVSSRPTGNEKNVHSQESKKSIFVGTLIEYKFKNSSSIFLEVNRSEKGVLGKRDLLSNFGYNPYELEINMLNFYIGGTYPVYKNHLLKAGVYYGRVLSVEETYSDETGGRLLGIRDITYIYEKDDYGLMLGFEFAIFKGMFAEFTYAKGLRDIRRDETHSGEAPTMLYHGEALIKTQIFSMGIGYKFKVGSR